MWGGRGETEPIDGGKVLRGFAREYLWSARFVVTLRILRGCHLQGPTRGSVGGAQRESERYCYWVVNGSGWPRFCWGCAPDPTCITHISMWVNSVNSTQHGESRLKTIHLNRENCHKKILKKRTKTKSFLNSKFAPLILLKSYLYAKKLVLAIFACSSNGGVFGGAVEEDKDGKEGDIKAIC